MPLPSKARGSHTFLPWLIRRVEVIRGSLDFNMVVYFFPLNQGRANSFLKPNRSVLQLLIMRVPHTKLRFILAPQHKINQPLSRALSTSIWISDLFAQMGITHLRLLRQKLK